MMVAHNNVMRVGFHMLHDFHYAMLNPIYALLKDEFSCLVSKDLKAIISFKPKILVLADAHYHYFRGELPESIMIWVRHGFSDKNHLRNSISGCDFACVSSTWVRDEYIRMGLQPRLGYWVTGFVPMDKVLARDKRTERVAFHENILKGKINLLYAPTYNKYLSSAEVLGSQWIDSICRTMPEINIIIKPHPFIPRRFPRWMAMWREAARRNKQTVLIEDSHTDIYDYFPFTDILLSDSSSVIFYFLAMDRPIVLVNNPLRFKDNKAYNPQGHEWIWRDVGLQIDHVDELPNALERSLQHPEELSPKRVLYRKKIFGNLLDGRAAERIAQRMRALLQPGAKDTRWVSISWKSAAYFGRFDKKKLQARKLLEKYPRIKFTLKRIYSHNKIRALLILMENLIVPRKKITSNDS